MKWNESEKGRSRKAKTLPASDRIRHFLGRVQWKRKLAAVLVTTFLTGTMADGLNAVGLAGYANAYASASPSDASRSDAVQLGSDDLPAKGNSLDYYLEDGDERNLYLSEAAIQEALEAQNDPEDGEELQLDTGLFGYEDPRAVVALYDEIQSRTKGYQLVLQGTFEDEAELSYFVYVKQGKKKDGMSFEDLQLVVINPNSAAEEDSQYNVRIWYEGEELRLEDGRITFKEMKELSRRQKKMAQGGALEDGAGATVNVGGPGASQEGNASGTVTGGNAGGGSGSGGSGGGSLSGGSSLEDPDQGGSPELPAPDEEDTEAPAPEEGSTGNPDAGEGSIDRPDAGEESTDRPGSGEGSTDRPDAGEGGIDRPGSQEKPSGSQDTENKDNTPENSGPVISDDGNHKDTSSDKAEGDAKDSASAGSDSQDKPSQDSGTSNQPDGSDKPSQDSTGDSGKDYSLSISRKWIHMVAEPLASSSQGSSDEEKAETEETKETAGSTVKIDTAVKGNTADTIAAIRQEMEAEGLKPYKLDPTGRFDMSELEMKLINQEEITEEDLEKAQGGEKSFLSKMFSSVSSLFTAADDEAEAGTEEVKEELSLEDMVGPDSSEYPAVLGLRQNTVAFVQSSMKRVAGKAVAGELDWEEQLPIKDGDVLFYGAEYPAEVLLPEGGTVTDENGNTYPVILTITGEDTLWSSADGADFSLGEKPEEGEASTAAYTLTYQVLSEAEGQEEEGFQKEITVSASQIHFNLPAFDFFIVGREYDLLDNGNVTAEDDTAEKKQYECRPQSVTYELIDQLETEVWEWDGKNTFTPFQKAKTHTVRYEAYIDYPGGTVVIGESDEVVVNVYQSGDLGETVDQAGDVAYVEARLNKDSFQTGTEPFDTKDPNKEYPEGYEPGDDWKAADNILRTFDTASYNVEVTSRVRDGSPYRHYKTGTLCFELILPGSASELTFDTDNMGWLHSKTNIQLEKDGNGNIVTTKKRNGKDVQVLRGSFLWEPTNGGENAIGESKLELKVVLRALKLQNGQEIVPEATFWLGVNDIGEGAGLVMKEGDTEGSAIGYQFPDRLITGSAQACDKHKTEEFVTVKTDPIIISARPMYNVELQLDGYTNTTVSKFDFNTGNEKAPNRGHEEVKEGRMGSLGAVLQIYGKENGTGLRGVEFPDLNQTIRFDVKLDSTFIPEYADGKQGNELELKYYKPLLWSAGENSYEAQEDDRKVEGKFTDTCARSVPLNRPRSNGWNRNSSCANGGSWTMTQEPYRITEEGKVEGGEIHVSVNGFEITEDLSKIPNTVPGSGNENGNDYFTRGSVSHYWELDKLCFSAGEFWIVQPFYRKNAAGEDILVLQDTEAIGTSCNAGVFKVKAEDVNLKMESMTHQPLAEQANTGDDKRDTPYNYRLPGTYISYVQYNSSDMNWTIPLTSGCEGSGKDWAALGTEMSLQCRIDHDGTDGNECGVAYDALVKFDDAMFEPQMDENGTSPKNSPTERILYGVRKSDPTQGWNHGSAKTPADEGYDDEMIHASFEQLEFYPLDQWKEEYVCVAVLCEWRGDYSWQMTHNHFFVKGKVKNNTDLVGNVYMVTQNTRAWERKDVVSDAIEYLNKESGATITKEEEITEAQWLDYAKNGFPTNAAKPTGGLRSFPDNFIPATNVHKGTGSPKTQYLENGEIKDGTDIHNIDSCLIVGYRATIKKSTAQRISNQNQAQVYYDLDVGQRVADYILSPTIERKGGTSNSETAGSEFVIDSLVVQDTLPNGLTYKPGSSYIGGTYETIGAGQQGQFTGVNIPFEGTEIDLKRGDGGKGAESVRLTIDKVIKKVKDVNGNEVEEERVRLTWTFKNVRLGTDLRTPLAPIYYSCDIGDINTAKNDVKDGQGLENEVTIGGTNLAPTYALKEGNMAVFEIKVSKLGATNVFKKAKQTAVEVGAPMEFSLKIGNNSPNETDIIAYDVVPFNGDKDGTKVSSGRISLNQVTVSCDNHSVMANLNQASGIKFYYTTSEDYKNRSSKDYLDSSGILNMEQFQHEVEAGIWILMDGINSSHPTHTFSGEPVTAIVAVGVLPAQTTLSLDTKVQIQDAKPGDYVGTTLSNRDLKSTAHSFVVSRTLEGLAWLDANFNGVQDSGEPRLENIQVTLKKKNGDSYEIIGTTSLGKAWDVHSKKEAEGYVAPGNYRFVNLPAGEFVVEFTGMESNGTDKGLFNIIGQSRKIPLEQCTITKQRQGDARYDSDAEMQFAGNSSDANGKHGEILNITMPEIEQIQVQNYAVRNQDMGIYFPIGNLTFDKIDSESKENLAGVEFELKAERLDNDDTFEYWAKEWITYLTHAPENWKNTAGIQLAEGEGGKPTSGESSLTVTFTTVSGHVDFSAGNAGWMLPKGKYTLTETKTLPGYTKSEPIIFYIIPGENTYSPDGEMKDAAYAGTNAVLTIDRAIQNTPQSYTIAKVREEDKTPLAGAVFTIYDGAQAVKTVTCDSMGEGTFFQSGLVKDNVYKLTETTVPAGYTAAADIWFKLVPNGVPDSNLLKLQLCQPDGTEAPYPEASLSQDQLKLTIEDTLETGSLTLRKELTGEEKIGDPNAEKEFSFTMTLKQPESYGRPAAAFALAEEAGKLYIKATRISTDSAGNQTEAAVRYLVTPGAANGIVKDIKLRAGESVRFDGIYYGTTFHIAEDQKLPTGFQFSGGSVSGGQSPSVNVANGTIYGKTVKGENQVTAVAENTVKLTSLPLVKTFNSDIPSILPVFHVYDITGRQEPFQSADDAPGTEDATWVDTITIEAQADGTYTGRSREVLMPGHTYQVVEYLDPTASYSDAYEAKVSEPVKVTVDMENRTNTLVLTPGAVAITNERSRGWLTISKRLNDHYGEELGEQRTFFYRVYPVDETGAEGEPLTLPEDYAVPGDPTIGTIVNGADAHWIFVPFGTYRVKEVDETGVPYDDKENPNPDYHISYVDQDMVLNPPKDVYLDANLYTVGSQIINTEKALGQLTLTKRTDWAEGGKTKFFFTVRNEKTGELVPAPGTQGKTSSWLERLLGSGREEEEGESLLWIITADKTVNTMDTVGSLTATGLPYGRYLVTEVDEEGNALSQSYPYDVSMEAQGMDPAYGQGSTEAGTDYQNPAMAVTVTNQRNRGYLQIRKTLQDYAGNGFQDKSREFYYTVLNSRGEAVDLPEEYQYRNMAHIGRITDEQLHTIFVPYETYRVLETDRDGRIYDQENPNPLYDVTNPEPVVLTLENADSASAMILNREKALGSLTLVKRSDRAYEGNAFYFQVENSKGEKIPMPDPEGNPTTELIWKIEVTQSVYEMAEVGSLTVKNLPYDTYQVTEVSSDGTALSEGFRYQVSYETKAQGAVRDSQSGTADIISPAVTVTVTNTRKPYSDSPGGGGSTGGGGGNPSRSNPPTSFIPDADVPLGGADGGDGDSLTEILDEDVPLYGLPKTGDTSASTAGILGLMLMSLLGAAGIMKKRKEEK